MNRHCYRIIFNKARGMLMVVSEAARSCSKAAGQSNKVSSQTPNSRTEPSQSRFFRFTSLGLSCLLVNVSVLQYAHADNTQIVADKNASIFHRPTILVAKNGTPIVDIRGANVRGVSRNIYSQFDIKDNGAILNNSPWGDDTQLAGRIRGNFWIMARPANIIVNEVNSNDPSIFNGKLEVAGRAADVIIANPSGININGGEFINAANTTLTTGKIGYTWLGNLDNIKVNQGTINIGEKGLHESGVLTRDSAFILAKSVALNGKITGDQQGLLQIVVGENDIDYKNHTSNILDTAITPHDTGKSNQGILLDIGKLGGAYARGIHIIGTDKGMGVTNSGTLKANNFIHINNNGRIENHGRMQVGDENSTNAVLNLRNKTQNNDNSDIINTGTLQAGNTINVQAGRDFISQGRIIRNSNNNQVSEERNDELNLFAERDLDINHIDNGNTKGDIYLIAKRNLNLTDTPQINSQDNILISAGNDLNLTDTKLQSSGDNKSVSLYSNHDLSINRSQIKATGKSGQVITSANGNQNLTNTNISADALTNRTGGTLTIRQATITNSSEATDTAQTNHNNQDVKLIAGHGIDAQGLDATAEQGSVVLEAARANLLGNPSSDITLTNSRLKAAKNTDIVAERNVSIENSTLTGEQIRSSAGNDLHLGLTGNNQASKNIYLRAGQNLSIDTDGKNSGKLVGSNIEAMAKQIELADNTQIQANTGDLKLSVVSNHTPLENTDNEKIKPSSNDISLGKNTQLTANKNISIGNDMGGINAYNLNLQSGETIGLVANNIKLQTTDKQQKNKLTSKHGDVVILDQNGTHGIHINNPDIQARQGKITLKSQSDIQITGNSNSNIQANDILIRSKQKTAAIQPTSTNIINTPANININHINLTAQNGQMVIDSNNTLSLSNSQLQSKDNIELHANEHLSIENITSNSSRHTAISGGKTLGISSSDLRTKGVLSTNSNKSSSLKESQLQAGALLITSDQANVELGNNLTLTTEPSDLLANNPKLAGVNGSMTIKSHDDLNIDAGKTINSNGQIDLRSQGKLTLKGNGGITGNGSQVNVKLNAKKDIFLTGNQVIMQGSDVNSRDGGIHVYSTAGDIEIQAITNDIDNVKPENRIAELNNKLAQINQHINILKNDNQYQDALTKKQAAKDKLNKLITDNQSNPIANFAEQRNVLEANIAKQVSAMNLRVKALNINKTHEELAEDKAKTNRSLQIANTPYKGQENYGTHLSAKDNIELISQGGVAIDAGQINTKNQAIIRSLTHQQTGRKIIDEQTRALFTIPLLKLNKLSEEQKQSYLQQQLALIDNLTFSLDKETNNNERYQEARKRLKDNISAAMQGDKKAQKIINDTLSAAPPIKIIPVAISIEGLHDIYQRGEEQDDIFSLHNNHRASNITADKGIIIQATGADNTDPTQVTSTDLPNSILLSSGDYIAKDGDIHISSVGNLIMQAGQDSIYDKETNTHTKSSWLGTVRQTTVTNTTEDIRDADPVTLVGNNITLNAADDIHGYAIELKSPKGNTTIKAGESLRLMAVEELNNKTVDTQKTSRFIGFKYNKNHNTNTRNIASELPSVVKSTITNSESGEDTQLQGTEFEYLEGANIKAGVGIKAVDDASIIFTTINKTVAEQQTNEFNNVVWQSISGKGNITESAELPKFTGPVSPTFEAPGGLLVQVPLGKKELEDSQNLVNVINTMANQPGYGYLKELIQRNDIDFSAIRLAQEDWKYADAGLTPAGAALLAVAVTWATGGVGAHLVGLESGIGASVANATFTSLATQASIALVNNQGDIKQTLKDLGSSKTARAILTSALTAGALEYVNTTVMPGKFKDLSIADAKSLQGRLVNGVFEGTTSALVDTAVNGGSLKDNLEMALLNSSVNAVHGFAASEIAYRFNDDFTRIVVQASAACTAAQLTNSDCEAGAIGAAVGEIVAERMKGGRLSNDLQPKEREKILLVSKLLAGTIAAYAGYDAQIAINKADIAVQNNALSDDLNKLGKQVVGGVAGSAVSLGSFGEIFIDSEVRDEAIEGLKILAKSDEPLTLIKLGLIAQNKEFQDLDALMAMNGDDFGRAMVDAKYATDISLMLAGVASLPKTVISTANAVGKTSALAVNGTRVIIKDGKAIIAATSAQLAEYRAIQASNIVHTVDLNGKYGKNLTLVNTTSLEGKLTTSIAGRTTITQNGKVIQTIAHTPIEVRATEQVLKAIDDFPSNSQADRYAAIIAAYDPLTGKIAVGKSNPNISRADLHPDTIRLVEQRLGTKIGDSPTPFCANVAGACAEVVAADALIRQGVKPDHIQFTKAYRPRIVRTKGVDHPDAVVPTCKNCSITFPNAN